jgi:uncharacterized membrane protein (UPF0182 family)
MQRYLRRPTLKQERLQRLIFALILFLLIVAPLFSSGVSLMVDWIWFGHEGYRIIYRTILEAEITLSGLGGMGVIAVVGLNLLIARALVQRYGFHVNRNTLEFPALDRFAAIFRGLIWLGILLVGYVVGQWASLHWREYLLNQHAVLLGPTDPIFHVDLGFYLFKLAYRWFLYHLALVSVILSLLTATFLYALEGGVWVTPRGPAMAAPVRAHLMALAGLFFALMAYRTRLAMYSLLFSPRGIIYGAGYADVHATLPVLRILMVLCLITALAFLAGAVAGRVQPALWSAGILAVVAFLGINVYPSLVEHFIVIPNQLHREEPYIRTSIQFTRQAYGLDHFKEHEFPVSEDLAASDIQKNAATMRNVRLWDHKPLLTTFAQLQEIRTYYDFAAVDNDRYWINGVYRQVSLSPRELSAANLPSRSWVNEHLIYTHGYGLCLSPVNEHTPDGLPVFFIKNIPPESSTPIKVTQPAIYYGEMTSSYCFVKSRQREFDYPSGNHDVYTTYAGPGGIPVENFWRRLLFSLRFGQKNILFSTDITDSSRLMIYRQILQRAERLAPFLSFDADPYMVVSNAGKLYWILDGYTTSARYPYSEPTPGVGNYIRNSVKATINAYSGRVTYYIADPNDPLIQAWSRTFPGVFHPLSAMPEDLRAHIRYPEGYFKIQASKYAVFHMTDPRVFYNKEDLWRVARANARGPATPMSPYYTIMKLPGISQTEEFILMVPFTPARKQNMIAWMAARCDAPHYGQVVVFTFPKQKMVYGPQQIESRIDQQPGISQQLTLWNQAGSRVIRGTLLVIPVKNSLLYVEPLYLAAEAGGGLPQLERVIVAYSDKVVMQDTLDDALTQIFGGSVSTGAPETASTAAGKAGAPAATLAPATALLGAQARSLIQQANQHYERALALERQGDWAGYGQEIQKLGQVLQQLAAQQR